MSMFPAAGKQSHSCLPGHVTAPPKDRERTDSGPDGTGQRPFVSLSSLQCLLLLWNSGLYLAESFAGITCLVCTLNPVYGLFLFLIFFFRLTFCGRGQYPNREVT